MFADVVGSIRVRDEHPAEMQLALVRHDEILRTVMRRCHSRVGRDDISLDLDQAGGMNEGRLPAAEGTERPETGPLGMYRESRPRHGGSVLMAAMLGLADAMGHDREPVEVVEVASDAQGEDLELDFGALESLD